MIDSLFDKNFKFTISLSGLQFFPRSLANPPNNQKIKAHCKPYNDNVRYERADDNDDEQLDPEQ